MRCIVHIGTEKTGTTTIQEFLCLNRKALLKQGFLFPESTGKRESLELPVSAYNSSRRDDITIHRNIQTNQDLFNHKRKVVSNLNRELRTTDGFKTTLFSSEHIQSRLTTCEELLRLKRILNGLGFSEISILVYLRNPVDVATSLYSTAIKFGHTMDTPPPPTYEYFRNICDHRSTIERYQAVFGEEAVTPRLFASTDLKKGCILTDFMETTGVLWDDEFVSPPNLNKQLSPLGLHILREVNKELPLFIDDKENPFRKNIVDYFENNFTGHKDSKFRLSEQLLSEYENEFNESNEWVRKKYFPKKKRLFKKTAFNKNTKIESLSNQDIQCIANLISSIWIDLQKQEDSTPGSGLLGLKNILFRRDT